MDMDVHGGRSKTVTGLRRRTISGISWSTVSQLGRQGTLLATTVVMARLLSPSDFGLIGMALVITGFVGIFRDLGTSAAIIQRKHVSPRLLSSIFWINVGFGALATLVLFLLAPLGGMLYEEPRVVAVLKVLSFGFFLSGFGVLHQALLERALLFRPLARLEIAAVLAGALVGVALALAGAGVWSLVFQSLTMVGLSTMLLWFSNSWRPQWTLNWGELKAVGRFSLPLTGFSIFNYFARNADYFLIGRYLGAQDLGYYTLAYRMLLFPVQNIGAVIARVMYPVFASIQADNRRIASSYLRMANAIALFSFPLMLGALALAEPLVLTAFGEQWQPAILIIMILAPVGLVQSLGTTVGSIFQAKGRTDWMFWWGIGSGTVAVLAFAIGLRWGIAGVAAAYAMASFILTYPGFWIPFRLIGLDLTGLWNAVRLPLFNACLMSVILVLFVRFVSPTLPPVLSLLVPLGVGLCVYAVSTWMTSRAHLIELWQLSGLHGTNFRVAG